MVIFAKRQVNQANDNGTNICAIRGKSCLNLTVVLNFVAQLILTDVD